MPGPTSPRAGGRGALRRLARWGPVTTLSEGWADLQMPPAEDPPPPHAFADFGAGSWIVPPARVTRPSAISIGDGVIVLEHTDLVAGPSDQGPLLTIGDRTRLARVVTVWATVGVHLGRDVATSDYVTLVDSWCPPDGSPLALPATEAAPIIIEDGAYLGCGSCIGPGVTVGRGAYVGEGAIVLEDVPAHAVVYGNPAQLTRSWAEEGGWQDASVPRTA